MEPARGRRQRSDSDRRHSGRVLGCLEAGDAPWATQHADIVLECSGKFRTTETLNPYFAAGVKKVIVATPVKAGALNIVMGVNDQLYEPEKHHLLTAASCTTNCLAPVVKVLHEAIGITHGVITTIHDITNTQVVVDAPHKDLRRARASSLSLIPTSTGSATAIGLIYPELLGKLTGIAVRVPLLNASLTDCVFEVKRPTSVEEVNTAFKRAAEGAVEGILGFEERPLVSVDFNDDPRSAIVDAPSTGQDQPEPADHRRPRRSAARHGGAADRNAALWRPVPDGGCRGVTLGSWCLPRSPGSLRCFSRRWRATVVSWAEARGDE